MAAVAPTHKVLVSPKTQMVLKWLYPDRGMVTLQAIAGWGAINTIDGTVTFVVSPTHRGVTLWRKGRRVGIQVDKADSAFSMYDASRDGPWEIVRQFDQCVGDFAHHIIDPAGLFVLGQIAPGLFIRWSEKYATRWYEIESSYKTKSRPDSSCGVSTLDHGAWDTLTYVGTWTEATRHNMTITQVYVSETHCDVNVIWGAKSLFVSGLSEAERDYADKVRSDNLVE